jgi:hypothetical protein
MNAELYCTRLCKNLMKKLGTAIDITFKSNIQVLLSSLLPLNHKSGLNISGKFSDQKNNLIIEAENEIEGTLDKLEYNFYHNFWTL